MENGLVGEVSDFVKLSVKSKSRQRIKMIEKVQCLISYIRACQNAISPNHSKRGKRTQEANSLDLLSFKEMFQK